jgi:Ankyrin repeats (3 copies)/Ankyrin repeats (many copies)
MKISKDVYMYLLNFVDDKTFLNMLSVNKYFHDEKFFQRVIERKYPLLIEFKKETWKELFLRMSYYIAKLGILSIPYISTKGYNPENFYKGNKNPKYIFDWAMAYAAKGGNMEIVKLMIEKGSTNFNTVMINAALGGNMEIVKLMIEKGATNFNSGMNYAAYGGNMRIVKFMIEKEATDFNLAMSFAARGGHMEIVKLLIEKGATSFNTAMRNAAEGGHMEIVKYLKQFVI